GGRRSGRDRGGQGRRSRGRTDAAVRSRQLRRNRLGLSLLHVLVGTLPTGPFARTAPFKPNRLAEARTRRESGSALATGAVAAQDSGFGTATPRLRSQPCRTTLSCRLARSPAAPPCAPP